MLYFGSICLLSEGGSLLEELVELVELVQLVELVELERLATEAQKQEGLVQVLLE